MSPPEPADGAYPFVLYNAGGALANFVLCGIFAALFVLLRGVFPYAGVIFIPIIGIGVILGVSNILPLKLGGVATDGHNIVSLKKSERARHAFWILLSANARMAQGGRSGDFPAEWFLFEGGYDFGDPVSANLAVMELSRLIDRHDFGEARVLAEKILSEGEKLIGLLKNEVSCELLFLEIIGEARKSEIERLYTPELQKYIKASKTHLSKHRLVYAYEKLVSRDAENAAKALDGFNKTCAAYPYAGDRESERGLLTVVDGLAADAYG
jgi:hypothetical protein